MQQEGLEKRKFVRFPFEYEIEHRLSDTETWYKGYCNNISLNGLSFFSNELYLTKDKIEMNFLCPLNKTKLITLTTTVIWSIRTRKEDNDLYVIGAQFIEVTDEQYEYLKKFIHECVKKTFETKLKIKIKERYKILFMDDNASLTKLFKCLGDEYQFDALIANNYEEGIQLALSEKPDIIITDINIPDGNGFALTSRLKVNEITKYIPIIGCSVTYPKSGRKFFLLGGSKFVDDKPSSIEKLNLILEGILPQIMFTF